jgi:hypothetical protein
MYYGLAGNHPWTLVFSADRDYEMDMGGLLVYRRLGIYSC